MRSLYVEPEAQPEQIDWPALELHDVFRIFRSGDVETVALRGVDLELRRRELVALLGPSGSGKSTLLALAAGLDQPSAGEVRAFGRSLARLGDEELARYRAREVAVVFQADNLWPALTARENVAVSLRLAGHPAADEAARDTLGAFGLEQRTAQRPAELSGGEQQRVAIAAAAARGASLVLADEPTAELDEQNERVVIEALDRLRHSYGCAVLVVTHAERVAVAADRVVELRDGRVAPAA